MRHKLLEKKDKRRYSRILKMQDRHKKEFFDTDGCGLEIEMAVHYEPRCREYIKTGLVKLKEFVGNRGKFVLDPTIASFLDVEIVLKPFKEPELKELFDGIRAIIDFYENFEYTEHCGVHANFRADGELKRAIYAVLTDGRYDSERFSHNKYKVDFTRVIQKADGSIMSYEEYLAYQKQTGAKYCGINFLKEQLVEIRTLNLSWDDVLFFCKAYDDAKALLTQGTE